MSKQRIRTQPEEMNMPNSQRLQLHSKPEGRLAWNYLLQKGFHLVGRAGMSVREFLADALGYDDRTIQEEVRTIFINSRPVDDIDTVYVRDGDRLALGSAMPGLVGICMGRDNPYKSFRSGIAAHGDGAGADERERIRVSVKIFSTLAVDTGAEVLRRGILIDAPVLSEFLERQKANLIPTKDMPPQALCESLRGREGDVAVTVEFK
jgi:hypothetical protein